MKVTKILLIGLFSAFFDSSDNRKKERRLTIIGLLEWLLLIANFCVLTFAIEISWWISLIMTIGVYLLLILTKSVQSAGKNMKYRYNILYKFFLR